MTAIGGLSEGPTPQDPLTLFNAVINNGAVTDRSPIISREQLCTHFAVYSKRHPLDKQVPVLSTRGPFPKVFEGARLACEDTEPIEEKAQFKEKNQKTYQEKRNATRYFNPSNIPDSVTKLLSLEDLKGCSSEKC
eukprot:11046745-Ditylum_brightwellii.AAC.1